MKKMTLLLTATLGLSIALAAPTFAKPANNAMSGSRVGLYVELDAKPGKEAAVADFLRGGKALVDAEPATTTWYAVQLSPSQFAIFDTFPDDVGRQAHLSGKVAAALMAQAPDLFAQPPVIKKVTVLAVKLPSKK
jgi:quinol monooxygenase YgiN